MMPPDRGSAPFNYIDLFVALSPEERERVASRLPTVSVNRGKIFYAPWYRGQTFFFLVEGRIRIYRASKGREMTVDVVLPGDFFGEASLAAMEQGAYAQAMENSTVAIMHHQTLRRLVEENPQVGMFMIETLIQRLNLQESRLEELALKEIPARLSRLLLRIGEEEGKKEPQGTLLPYRYTHQTLASLIGCERPALTRALHQLEKIGAMLHSGRDLYIIDPETLKQASQDS